MDPKVKEFLESKHQEEQSEKEKLLIRFGLYYEDESNNETKDYVVSTEGIAYVNNKQKKKIPCKVSNEEYEEILKYSQKHVEYEYKSNASGIIVIVLGYLSIILGVIAGISIGHNEGWIIALSSVFSGLLMIVFGRISTTLTDILNRINKM